MVFDSRTTCACPPGTAPAPTGDASTPQAVLCFVRVRIGEADAPCNGPVTLRTLYSPLQWGARGVGPWRPCGPPCPRSCDETPPPTGTVSNSLEPSLLVPLACPLLTNLPLPTRLHLLGLFPTPLVLWSFWPPLACGCIPPTCSTWPSPPWIFTSSLSASVFRRPLCRTAVTLGWHHPNGPILT